jgi:hypothetical protein
MRWAFVNIWRSCTAKISRIVWRSGIGGGDLGGCTDELMADRRDEEAGKREARSQDWLRYDGGMFAVGLGERGGRR